MRQWIRDGHVDILHRRQFDTQPRVSFVLLDWSCRESLHTLDFLAEQDVPRDSYEILWIEYYSRRHQELQQRIADARRVGAADPVDTWIVMNTPDDVCHHKHLMYNVGIVASGGELVCFCDSDAMVRPGFVRSILESFDREPEIVLHHDEVRNRSPRFYPFRYPTFEDVTGPGCNNWVNGRPLGLWDEVDPLHTRNYGASMTARRDDLVAIGGADMHADYLGHVCGPYELTFRLVNAGRREVWNDTEYLYHTWHPGQAGTVDYCGPHDGRHMSTTALEAIVSGRVLPLEGNPAIEALRRRAGQSADLEAQLKLAVEPRWLQAWSAAAIAARAPSAHIRRGARTRSAFDRRMTYWQQLRLLPFVLKLLVRQYRIKLDKLQHARPWPAGTQRGVRRWAGAAGLACRTLRGACAFLPAAVDYAKYLIRVCWLHLAYARSRGSRELILWGDSAGTSLCRRLAGPAGIRIAAIHQAGPPSSPDLGLDLCSVQHIRDGNVLVLIAAFANAGRFRARLNALGISDDRIITLS